MVNTVMTRHTVPIFFEFMTNLHRLHRCIQESCQLLYRSYLTNTTGM